MRYIFYVCEVCDTRSDPEKTPKKAQVTAAKAGFVFIANDKGSVKCYCKKHAPARFM